MHMVHRHTCPQNTKGSISTELMTEQMNEQLSLHSAHRMVSISSVRNKLSRIIHMTNDQQTCTLKPSTWNTMNCLGGHINTHGVVWQHPHHHTYTPPTCIVYQTGIFLTESSAPEFQTWLQPLINSNLASIWGTSIFLTIIQ